MFWFPPVGNEVTLERRRCCVDDTGRPLQAFLPFSFSEFHRDLVPSHQKTFTARMWDKEMSRVPAQLFALIGGIIK